LIVVDVNILAYFSITGEKTELAHAALRKDSDIVSSILWRSEFCSVLVRYLWQGLVSLQDASTILKSVQAPMYGRELSVDPIRVVKLAYASACSSYDAEYVVLAKELSIRLLTEDKEIPTKFPDVAISLRDFIAPQ
jgi:predicted nucleic acid-binding protein